MKTMDETILRFNKGSEQYRTDSIRSRKLSADRVSHLVMPKNEDIILDIGCGTGTQLIELSGRIKRGIGIDISPGMVQKANGQLAAAGCGNLEFHLGDFLNPEREIFLENMNINKIISNYALHHLDLESKKQAVEKMIGLGGNHLEMIVIGDLMFFDKPDRYADQYDEIGYGPAADQPCYARELAGMFDEDTFIVTLEKIHPLVGVLKAEKG